MEKEITKNFLKAWKYLNGHPIFQEIKKAEDEPFEPDWLEIATNKFQQCLDIHVVKVNPLTKDIDDDKTKNTLVNIWLEAGPYNAKFPTHDISLDCGGDTFEEAIIELAKLVKGKYGDEKEKALAIVNGSHK